MIIVIDGYNVIKQCVSQKKITSEERQSFIDLLVAYSQKTGHEVVVFFDGWAEEQVPRFFDEKVRIIYAGFHQTADTCIKLFLQKIPADNALLVSSDNDIKQAAAQLKIAGISAFDFYSMLQDRSDLEDKSAVHIVKTSSENNDHIDQLMHRVGEQSIYQKEDDSEKNRESKKYTLSKKDRLLVKKLKKL